MRKLTFATALCVSLIAGPLVVSMPGQAAIKTDSRASNFILTDSAGKRVELADFRGKPVVIEWHNPGCPFVQKHYSSGNMQKTQRMAKSMGVIWLTINSGAKGKQGDITAAEANRMMIKQEFASDHYLFDRDGHVGKAYGARTTPHMYIVDSAGTLVFQGGIDDKPTADPADIATARNHVLAALGELNLGKPISVSSSRPYGCSVKYAA